MTHRSRPRTLVSALLIVGLVLAFALAPFTASSVRAASVLYVKPGAPDAADCLTWGTACSLQGALGKAASGETIWVAAGVHYPGASRTDTFTLLEGVAVYGGFSGVETALDQRDWLANLTVLSGDIDQNDTKDAYGVVVKAADIAGSNTYQILNSAGLSASARLDGFVITAGQANGSSPVNNGAGMYNSSSSPTLANLIFSGCYASANGGAMFNDNSSPAMTNVTFTGNAASGGGGIYNYGGSSPVMTAVLFSGNTGTAGGALVNDSNSNPVVTNAAFISNTASSGGGIYNYQSTPVLVNVSFSKNSANGGGALFNYFSNSTLSNCILWGDSAPSGAEIYDTSSTPTVTYSIVQGGHAGTGNLAVDPMFVDPDGDDNLPGTRDDHLKLNILSPAIDAGDNSAVPGGILSDLAGALRFVDIAHFPDTGSGTAPLVDMGAWEVQVYTLHQLFLPLTMRSTP